MLTRSIHAPSLVIGVLGAAVVLLSMSQLAPATSPSWGPPKKSIVNVFLRSPASLPLDGEPVPPGASFVVHQVPADRWLTVTASDVSVSGYVDGLYWSEEFGGAQSEKGPAIQVSGAPGLSSPSAGGGVIGWTFRPRSTVTIRNVGSGVARLHGCSLLGYETRA